MGINDGATRALLVFFSCFFYELIQTPNNETVER